MNSDEKKRELLRELLAEALQYGTYPEVTPFRLAHESDRNLIDELIHDHFIEKEVGRYILPLKGLRECDNEEARAEIEFATSLIPVLQDAYRHAPGGTVKSEEMAQKLDKSEGEVQRALTILRRLPVWGSLGSDRTTGLVNQGSLAEAILDASPRDIAPIIDDDDTEGIIAETVNRILTRIEIDGYRPFRGFSAEPGDLTVIIGANATGKSSLFDFLHFVHRASEDPLPPEIDERAAGKELFHTGGPERITFTLTLEPIRKLNLQYEADILGPVGAPKVVRERLETRENDEQPFIFLDFTGGQGVVRDQSVQKLLRPKWTVESNELALRRALDPTLTTLFFVQSFFSSWRFYSGFDMASGTSIRRPVPTEPKPKLLENGSNLSAVLMWLNHEHQDAWGELETHLRSAVPGFHSLNVKPRGGPGTVIGTWRESGVKGELTLADLSDGTLRFLCWAALCLAPGLPPLMCIDEPELGLHPRVLPVLAGLFRLASARTQVLITTHSPYFLSHFNLDEIAVMRKEDGAARFIRPASSKALREMVKEVGGEALTRLHLSDELEILP